MHSILQVVTLFQFSDNWTRGPNNIVLGMFGGSGGSERKILHGLQSKFNSDQGMKLHFSNYTKLGESLQEHSLSRGASDMNAAKKCWEVSEGMVKLQPSDPKIWRSTKKKLNLKCSSYWQDEHFYIQTNDNTWCNKLPQYKILHNLIIKALNKWRVFMVLGYWSSSSTRLLLVTCGLACKLVTSNFN